MRKGVIISVLVTGFLAFWGAGMITGLASSGCRKGLSTPERTDRACNISKKVMPVFKKIGDPERVSEAEIFIGYAVSSFRSDEPEQAKAEFETAYQRGMLSRHTVALTAGYAVPEALLAAIVRAHRDSVPKEAQALWYQILEQKNPSLTAALRLEPARSKFKL